MPETTPNNNNPSHRPSLPFSSTSSAIVIDGAEEDAILAKSEFLTRYEVLKRRSRRTKQLARIYKDHYWALMEDLRTRYRDYYWEYGKSPFEEEEENNANNIVTNNFHELKVECGDSNVENLSNPNKNSTGRVLCSTCLCKNKAMDLTMFCHTHILLDSKQKLYMACNYNVKNSPSGPVPCGKPTLKSIVPNYCLPHFQKSEKYVTTALKKAGHNVSCASRKGPKLHVVLAEYVNQIQQNRRKAASEIAIDINDVSAIEEV